MAEMNAVFEGPEPDVERATEVFAERLDEIGAYSNDDVDMLANAWELTHGRPLWRDTHETYENFIVRAEAFRSTIRPKRYFMDRTSAQESLMRLRDVEEPSGPQQREINELEEILDLQKTNFKKSAKEPKAEKADVSKAALDRYLRIQAEDEPDKVSGKREKRTWNDRLALTEREEDFNVLQLIITQDEHPEVRAAAEKRLARLTAAGR